MKIKNSQSSLTRLYEITLKKYILVIVKSNWNRRLRQITFPGRLLLVQPLRNRNNLEPPLILLNLSPLSRYPCLSLVN